MNRERKIELLYRKAKGPGINASPAELQELRSKQKIKSFKAVIRKRVQEEEKTWEKLKSGHQR